MMARARKVVLGAEFEQDVGLEEVHRLALETQLRLETLVPEAEVLGVVLGGVGVRDVAGQEEPLDGLVLDHVLGVQPEHVQRLELLGVVPVAVELEHLAQLNPALDQPLDALRRHLELFREDDRVVGNALFKRARQTGSWVWGTAVRSIGS